MPCGFATGEVSGRSFAAGGGDSGAGRFEYAAMDERLRLD